MESTLPGDPLVSVIMPTYQQAQYLPTAILSVLAQTYPNVELIIVGVKEDKTVDVIQKHPISRVFSSSWLKLLESEKADHIHQINLGLKEAKGEFTVLFGSDDFMLPNKIEHELSVGGAANAVLVYSRFFITDEHLNIQIIPPIPPFSYQRLVHGNFIVDSCLVAKTMYEEFGLLEESLGSLAVYDKWLHIAEKYESNIIFNPVPVILYRTHPQQKHISRLTDPKQIELYNQIVNASLKRKGINKTVQFKLSQVEMERV